MRNAGRNLVSAMCGEEQLRAFRGDAFDRAIADFSAAYADQNERDYAALVDAVRSGRITAQAGV